jgi:hypothetical protein
MGFKTRLAMDAELGIQVVFTQSDVDAERRMVVEDLVDLGVGAYVDTIENDEVKAVRVDPAVIIISYCRRQDFKDKTWWGRMIWVTLNDISPYFSDEQLQKIAELYAGKNGNPRNVPYNFSFNDYDKFKVLVLDGEWLTFNTNTYKRDYTSNGNYIFKKKKVDKRDGSAFIEVQGEDKPKFAYEERQEVYVGKWIVDSPYIYAYGRATDQKRRRGNYKETMLSLHCIAPDFYEMMAIGMIERITPYVDEYCLNYYKIQNFKQKWIPYIIKIDLTRLENVNLGKGGSKMKPYEIIDHLIQNQILVTRSKNAVSGMPQPPSEPLVENTQMAEELRVLIEDQQRIIDDIRKVTGLNEVVDGTGPQDRTNVIAQQQAQAGSNNAINQFIYADSKLLCDLADSCLLRLQRLVKRKKVQGYIHALGSGWQKFAEVSSDISLHDYAIKIEDQPDTGAKQLLIQQLNIRDGQGLIEPEDWFIITNMTNMKEAQFKLIYNVRKRKQEAQANQIANQQAQAQGNTQTALQLEQAKQQTLALEYSLKEKLADHTGMWMYLTESMKKGVELQQSHADLAAKMVQMAIDAGGLLPSQQGAAPVQQEPAQGGTAQG